MDISASDHNTSCNLDSDGFINSAYYKNASLDVIQREAEQNNIDLNKISANKLRALLRSCYHSIFEPDKRIYCNNACNIPYSEENINRLLSVYIEICELYSCIPSLMGFERYSGIQEDTLKKYVTVAGSLMCKMRKDYIQNALSDTPVGQIALANNDIDTGLMYNRQNMIERETVRQGLTLNDFVKISQKDDKH